MWWNQRIFLQQEFLPRDCTPGKSVLKKHPTRFCTWSQQTIDMQIVHHKRPQKYLPNRLAMGHGQCHDGCSSQDITITLSTCILYSETVNDKPRTTNFSLEFAVKHENISTREGSKLQLHKLLTMTMTRPARVDGTALPHILCNYVMPLLKTSKVTQPKLIVGTYNYHVGNYISEHV